MSNTLSNVVILGGGNAGWLTALFVKRTWPKLNVTLIEDPNRPPVIAGESGTSTFQALMTYLKIDFEDFVKETKSTPKMGGDFRDWDGVGSRFIHALQTDYAPWLEGWTDYIDAAPSEELNLGTLCNILHRENQKDVFLKSIIGNNSPLYKAFFAGTFIDENRVPVGGKSDIPCYNMWHFESRSAAGYFKKVALQRDIKLIEGVYQTANLDNDGNITSLQLEDGQIIEGDWFFDCSGFARLLLGKVYNEPIIDYTNYFPARSVVAWWDKPNVERMITTNATAMKYGWSWNISLRHRSGNGYVFDPDLITLDQAIQEASEKFNVNIEPVANFTYQPGLMRNGWKNNTIAIGLSSGFLEPLEANGVYVIIEALYTLQDHWKPYQKDQREASVQRFNDRLFVIQDDVKDFLCLHYRGHRDDSDFWLSHKNDAFRIPDSLRSKLEAWGNWYNGSGIEPYFNGYSHTAWLMVLQGINRFDHTKIISNENILKVGEKVLNINVQKYEDLAKSFWTIEEWLKKYE